MRIVFFLGTLGNGGAERQACLMAKGLVGLGHSVDIVTLFPEGMHWDKLVSSKQIPVRSLFGRRSQSSAGVAWQLLRAHRRLSEILQKEQADIVYSFLEIPNFIAKKAVSSVSGVSLVWGIRNSSYTRSKLVLLAFRQCAKVSRDVPLILFNSKSGQMFYESSGYRGKKHLVIPNGIDTDHFSPQRASALALRREWLGEGNWVAGLVGRIQELKGHSVFIDAAAMVIQKHEGARFVCVGDGDEAYRVKMEKMIKEKGLVGKVFFTGRVDAMQSAYNALDLVVSASIEGEGFPNVLAEAMSCGVPCLGTDAGDSKYILGDHSRILKQNDSKQLADAMVNAIDEQKVVPDSSIRNRVKNLFGFEKMVLATEKALELVLEESK